MKISRSASRRFNRVFVLVAFLAMLFSSQVSVLSDPLDQWTRRHPFPSWAGVVYGTNLFVAVGDGGAIQTSGDGITWSAPNSGTTASLAGVAYGGGKFVVVGASGKVLFSTNGALWFTAVSGTASALAGLTYANGIFVAVGDSGTALTSSNGINWTSQSGISPSLALISVAFGNGLFVAITSTGAIVESPDGVTWSSQPAQGGAPTQVVFLNNRFVLVDSGIKYSPDGANWVSTNTVSPALQAMTYAGGYYAGVGPSGTIQYSTNGTNWTVASSQATYGLTSIAYGNGTFVTVGGYGLIRTSTDHVNWPTRAQTLTYFGNLYGIKYINNQFVAVGDGSVGPGGQGEFSPILFSNPTTGNWYRQPSATAAGMWDVAYGNGRYVICDSFGLQVSTNGVDWSSVGSGLSTQLAGLTFANNLFVLTAWGGGIATSPDGLTWTPRTTGTTRNLWGVTYGNGNYVAVGQQFSGNIGGYVVSADGTTWTSHTILGNMRNVAFGLNTFVAVGDSGYVGTSTSGTGWTQRSAGTSSSLYGVCFGDGYFVAVGTGGFLATSTDGINWAARNSGTTSTLERVAFGNGNFTVTGDGGLILQSAPTYPTLFSRKTPSGMEVDIIGGFDRAYQLQTSSNLNLGGWTPLVNVPSGQRQFIDPDVVSNQKFYRLTTP